MAIILSAETKEGFAKMSVKLRKGDLIPQEHLKNATWASNQAARKVFLAHESQAFITYSGGSVPESVQVAKQGDVAFALSEDDQYVPTDKGGIKNGQQVLNNDYYPASKFGTETVTIRKFNGDPAEADTLSASDIVARTAEEEITRKFAMYEPKEKPQIVVLFDGPVTIPDALGTGKDQVFSDGAALRCVVDDETGGLKVVGGLSLAAYQSAWKELPGNSIPADTATMQATAARLREQAVVARKKQPGANTGFDNNG